MKFFGLIYQYVVLFSRPEQQYKSSCLFVDWSVQVVRKGLQKDDFQNIKYYIHKHNIHNIEI